MRQSINTARSLRAVGQALELLQVNDFELKPDGDDFVVSGHVAQASDTQVEGEAQQNPVDQVWGVIPEHRAHRPGKANPQTSIELRYTREDIERLEAEGRARRTPYGGTIDPERLSQLLRTVGAYVSDKRGRLMSMSRRNDRVMTRYMNAAGRRVEELLSASILYDFWAGLYMRRASRVVLS